MTQKENHAKQLKKCAAILGYRFDYQAAMIKRWRQAGIDHRHHSYSHQTGVLRGWRKGLKRSQAAIVKRLREIKAELTVIANETRALQ